MIAFSIFALIIAGFDRNGNEGDRFFPFRFVKEGTSIAMIRFLNVHKKLRSTKERSFYICGFYCLFLYIMGDRRFKNVHIRPMSCCYIREWIFGGFNIASVKDPVYHRYRFGAGDGMIG